MNKFLLVLTGIISCLNLQAQKPLGTWTSFLPYGNSTNVAVAGDKVFCATKGGAFYYNKQDNSIHKFSREDGLSDTEISSLAWAEQVNTLVIAYASANIDLVKDNEIYNIPDIERKQMLGDKGIYSVYVKDDKAYLATGFGIVLLDILRREIKETYFIAEGGQPVVVNDIVIHGNTIFAASNDGVFVADLNSSNLIDYNSWIRQDMLPAGKYSSVTAVDNSIFVNKAIEEGDDAVYEYSAGTWSLLPEINKSEIRDLSEGGGNLIVAAPGTLDLYSTEGVLQKEMLWLNPVEVIQDPEGVLWIADKSEGLVRIAGDNRSYLKPDGPSGIEVSSLVIDEGKLLATAGGPTSGWANNYRPGALYRYDGNEWSNWLNNPIKDLYRIAVDPADASHYFVSSWGYGLLEFKDGEMVEHYTTENSSLQTIIQNEYYIRIGGLAFDRDGNLWMSNSGVSEPLSVLKADGEWKSFNLSSRINSPNIDKMIYTDDGSLWMILPRGYGLFVFNSNGTPDNTEDDRYRKLSVVDENNKIITNDIYSIAQDREGNIWLGTNKGVLIYYNPSRVFDNSSFYAHIPLVPREESNFADPLLGTETVTAIKVDGANRKWLGTRNAGVFLVSEDGLEQIHTFNTSNSPLLSNSISDIAINEQTGEVFFATGNGIIAYTSDAREPAEAFSDVYAYPNPVREDYYGDIVITGLIENTLVKITDLNGNLVHETTSLGGNAIWNGKNLHGERVSTGVYLVFCTNDDGSLTHVTKLLFIH